MIKRLEGLKKGDAAYLVPTDPRCKPQICYVESIGPKFITLKDVTLDLKKVDSETGRTVRWSGWELYKTKQDYELEKDFIFDKGNVITYFREYIDKMLFTEENAKKLKRLLKRYEKYHEELPF